MQIAFYTPFKPLGHPHPSGDLVTAAGLYAFLAGCGHSVTAASTLRCRWIYWKPWRLPALLREHRRLVRRLTPGATDLWFTYHSYYKAPDLLGPGVAQRLGVPYVIFQGIYSTKRRRDLRTLPGFYLNRRALCAAARVFTNKKIDFHNLIRLLPGQRVTYVAPGLDLREFRFDPAARQELRRRWQAADEPVVLSVAMFRAGVKTDGLLQVIRTCGELRRRRRAFKLVIVGAGKMQEVLRQAARVEVPEAVFAGRVARAELYRYYSAADLFVFPGIQESLGMVYLEAQACGLPAVAFENAGTPEAIEADRTGFLVPLFDAPRFRQAVERLLLDAGLRCEMGAAAAEHVRRHHDRDRNYAAMEAILKETARKG